MDSSAYDARAKQGLSRVNCFDDALDWWIENLPITQGTTLVVSQPEASAFSFPTQQTFGSIQLLSMFSYPFLSFLNDRIANNAILTGSSDVGIEHLISFDTNIASFLRGLFNKRSNANVVDLKAFMTSVQGNKINWDIRPYLHENADALLAGERDREIYETVLASEQLSALDVNTFLTKGELRSDASLDELRGRAGAETADFLSGLRSGQMDFIRERHEPIYASVLYMAILTHAYPGRQHATKKLRLIIEFMDKEFAALFWGILWTAWRWFDGDKRTGLLNTLQPGGKDPVKKAQNISWDLYHLMMRPEVLMTSRKGADVLIPSLLTGDKMLARLWEVYPIRCCWANSGIDSPYCEPVFKLENDIPTKLSKDESFMHEFLSDAAYRRRDNRLNKGETPGLKLVIQELENQLGGMVNDRTP